MTRNNNMTNRAFLYGDGVFETVRISNGKVLFAEDHYFRLMASMRILRMQIPMDFTLEYFESIMVGAAADAGCADSARARITVYRDASGLYLPQSHEVAFITEASKVEPAYGFTGEHVVDIYKDATITAQLLSTVKSTNRLVNILAAIYAEENGWDNCLLMNERRNIVEASNGNVFALLGGRLLTPALSEGCIKGIMRRQVIAVAKNMIEVEEGVLSPFDLQNADEIFITNVVQGIRPVTRYRKKEYGSTFADTMLMKINELAGLSN